MTLPTTLNGILASSWQDHADWHNELDGYFPHLGLPTVSLSTPSGHPSHHDLLHGVVGGTLRPDVNATNIGHALDHLKIHIAATTYGADAVLGETLEPATTTGTQATTGTIASVLSAASPGDTILLRAGSYSGFTIPAGTAGNPITVKPYNAEAVTITSQFTMNSYTRLAGVLAESVAAQWLTRIGSTTSTAMTDVEIRNCTIRGGTTEAVRIRQNCNDVRLLNCDLEGGQTGHVIKVHFESITTWSPSASIVNCRLRKRNIAGGGIYNYATTEDLLQLEGFGTVVVSRLTLGQMQASTSAEDGLDVKSPNSGTGGSAVITHTLFEGPFGAEAGILQALADDIFLRYSKVIGDSLSVGATSQNVSAQVDHCWFTNNATLQVRRSGILPRQPVRISNNVLDGGTFQLGTTTAGDQPDDALLTGNTFNGTNIVVNPGGGSATDLYDCDGTNVFNSTTGATLVCS